MIVAAGTGGTMRVSPMQVSLVRVVRMGMRGMSVRGGVIVAHANVIL